MSSLRLRQTYTIVELRLDLPESGELLLNLGGAHALAVSFREVPDQPENAVCTATSEVPLSDRMRNAFVALREHKLPVGHPTPDEDSASRGIQADGTFPPNLVVSPSDLPGDVSDFVATVSRELSDAIQRTALTLRWRHAGTGDHQPFSSNRPEWSLDGEGWYPLPSALHTTFELRNSIRSTSDSVAQVEAMVGQGCSEPIGHSLWREAWEQRIRNPRSALIIGVAALEVGVKQCIANLEPTNEWLLEHFQSPRVEILLNEYLPRMKTRNTIAGKTLPPPAPIMEAIKKAVAQRNRVAHVTGVALWDWGVQESLKAIRDVLWLLDFYQGHAWALDHLRRDTRTALIGSSEG